MTRETLPIGTILDEKYRIEEPLGEGGMGAVYRATHLGTKRIVAIKVINPKFSNNHEFVERFRREAEATGRLRHPNVVDVTDFGFARDTKQNVAYLVMEYLDGCTLADVLAEEGKLPLDWVVDIMEQACSALDEAHRLGIVHRDLKPENIWLEPNRRGGYTIKVLDFGLVKLGAGQSIPVSATPEAGAHPASVPSAKTIHSAGAATQAGSVAEMATLIQHEPVSEDAATLISEPNETVRLAPQNGDAAKEDATQIIPVKATSPLALETAAVPGLTRVGSVMGTPLYMSPEQCRGELMDARSDIYSLGIVAYRMLAGETPFSGEPEELIKLHTSVDPPAIREKNRKVPRNADRLVMKSLEKDKDKRPQTAAGFASSLRAVAEGSGTVLREAVSMYSERFPTFLKVSLLGYAPLFVILALQYISDKLIPWNHMSHMTAMATGVVEGLLAPISGQLLALFVISGATVPIVIQSNIAPLRPLSIRSAFAALARRWKVFLGTSLIVTTAVMLGSILLIVPGILASICFGLYAPVVVMERKGVFASLKRAFNLMKRSWTTVLIITVIQFALPIVILTLFNKVTMVMNSHQVNFGISVSDNLSGRLSQLINVLVTPLSAIMTALLYLKTRRAGGETLRDAMEQFDAQDIPRSKWQARMRSRSSLTTGHSI